MRRAEVGDQDDAGIAIERQHGCGATAGRGAASGLVDEALPEERVDPLGDRGARQPGLAARSARVTATSSRIKRKSAPALVGEDWVGSEFVTTSEKSKARVWTKYGSFCLTVGLSLV